jgi:hypothetical protein
MDEQGEKKNAIIGLLASEAYGNRVALCLCPNVALGFRFLTISVVLAVSGCYLAQK